MTLGIYEPGGVSPASLKTLETNFFRNAARLTTCQIQNIEIAGHQCQDFGEFEPAVAFALQTYRNLEYV